MIVRLFCPFDPDRFLIIVDVVFVIGMAATAAALVVASTIGINFSVVMCVEFNKMLGIISVCVSREGERKSESVDFLTHSLPSFARSFVCPFAWKIGFCLVVNLPRISMSTSSFFIRLASLP